MEQFTPRKHNHHTALHQHHTLAFALALETLEWEAHINKIRSEANSTLGFLRRNLKACYPKKKKTANFSLVRSSLEYSSAVWDLLI